MWRTVHDDLNGSNSVSDKVCSARYTSWDLLIVVNFALLIIFLVASILDQQKIARVQNFYYSSNQLASINIKMLTTRR